MKRLLLAPVIALVCIACGQNAKKEKTFVYDGNPLVKDCYTADPAPMENYVEGPWLYKRGGHYYNVYASMGDHLETISYAMAPSVQGPWTFAGELLGEQKDSFTTHPGIIDYKGRSYLFYHGTSLSLDGYGPATGRRSICFTEIAYDQDGKISIL